VDKGTGLIALAGEYRAITKLLYPEPVYLTAAVWSIMEPSIRLRLPYIRTRIKREMPWEWNGVIFHLLFAAQLQKRVVGSSPDGSTVFFRAAIKDCRNLGKRYHLHVFRLDRSLRGPAPRAIIISLADHY